jgi:hypothetical protein
MFQSFLLILIRQTRRWLIQRTRSLIQKIRRSFRQTNLLQRIRGLSQKTLIRRSLIQMGHGQNPTFHRFLFLGFLMIYAGLRPTYTGGARSG